MQELLSFLVDKPVGLLVVGSVLVASAILASPSSMGEKQAAELYSDYCSVCHGERGDGRSHAVVGMVPPPKDFTRPGMLTVLPRERMITSVREGVKGTAMVGWKTQLDDGQVEAIVDFIRDSLMTVAPPHSTAADNGEAIYAFNCSVCHGEDGSGAMWGSRSMNPPPLAFRDLDPEADLPRARMIASVTHGRPGSSMMSFASQLTPPQIELVVDYIREKLMSQSTNQPRAADVAAADNVRPTSSHPNTTVGLAMLQGRDQVPSIALPGSASVGGNPDAPMPNGLAGDPQRGGVSFAENCTACHGASGEGNGPRAYFIYPRPISFLAEENRPRLSRAGLFDSIKQGVRGREMPAWGKVLDDQEIADIAEFVFTAFVDRSSPGQEAAL